MVISLMQLLRKTIFLSPLVFQCRDSQATFLCIMVHSAVLFQFIQEDVWFQTFFRLDGGAPSPKDDIIASTLL